MDSNMGSLQWHMHTFRSSDCDVSDDCSDWDSDMSSSSCHTDLDLQYLSHCSGSIDSTDSFGPVHPLDAFLESAVAPEDLPDTYELAITPDDFVSSDSDDPESALETEYNNDELLLLNTPDALYQLFCKGKLQVRINSSKRWELLCPDCAEWCQTGIHSGINLWISGQFVSLSNHRGSRKCHQKAAKNKLPMLEKNDNMFNIPATRFPVTSNDTRYLFSVPPYRMY